MTKQSTSRKKGSRGGASAKQTETVAAQPQAERPATSSSSPPPDSAAPERPTGKPQDPAAGLDAAKHAKAQRNAHGAEVLRKGAFPALMATALAIDPFFDTGAYKLYLDQIKEDAGNPTDPIEVMLLEQLCMAHWRIAQLHVSAGQTKSIEGTKMYNSVSARLLGEFRRTALALRVYQGQTPKGKSVDKLKIFKAAQ